MSMMEEKSGDGSRQKSPGGKSSLRKRTRLGEQVFVRNGKTGYHPAKIVLGEPTLAASNDEMVLVEWDTTGYRQHVPIGDIDWISRTNTLGTTRNSKGARSSNRVNKEQPKQPVAVFESTPNRKRTSALNIDTASTKKSKSKDPPTTISNVKSESKTTPNTKKEQLVPETPTTITSQNGGVVSSIVSDPNNRSDHENLFPLKKSSHAMLKNTIQSTFYDDKPINQKIDKRKKQQRTYSMTSGQSTDSVADNRPIDRHTGSNCAPGRQQQHQQQEKLLHTASEHEVASIISAIARTSTNPTSQHTSASQSKRKIKESPNATGNSTTIWNNSGPLQSYDHITNPHVSGSQQGGNHDTKHVTAQNPITATTPSTRKEKKAKASRRSDSISTSFSNQLIQKPDKTTAATTSVNDHYPSSFMRNDKHTASMYLSNQSAGQQSPSINSMNNTRRRSSKQKRLGKREVNENIKNFFESSRQLALSTGIIYGDLQTGYDNNNSVQDNGIYHPASISSLTTTVSDTGNAPQSTFISLDSNSTAGAIRMDAHSSLLPRQVPGESIQPDNNKRYYYTENSSSGAGAFLVDSHLRSLPQAPKDPLPENKNYYSTQHSQVSISQSPSSVPTDCIPATPVVQSILDISPLSQYGKTSAHQTFSFEKNSNASDTISFDDNAHRWSSRDDALDEITKTRTLSDHQHVSEIDDGHIAELVSSSDKKNDREDINESLLWWGVCLLVLLVSILGKLIDTFFFSRQ